MDESRLCNFCKQIQPLSEFIPRKDRPGKYRSRCRTCWRKYKREYGANNPEIIKAQNARTYAKDPAKGQAYSRKRRQEKPIEIYFSNKRYIEANRKEVNKKAAARARKNHQRRAEDSLKRSTAKLGGQVFYVTDKEVKTLYSADCFYCQASKNQAILTIEHLIPRTRKGSHGIGNLITLCKSCNSSKGDKTWMEWRLWKAKREGIQPTH